MCARTHTHACAPSHACTHSRMHTHILTRSHVHTSVHSPAHVCAHTCTHTCEHTPAYVCACTCMPVTYTAQTSSRRLREAGEKARGCGGFASGFDSRSSLLQINIPSPLSAWAERVFGQVTRSEAGHTSLAEQNCDKQAAGKGARTEHLLSADTPAPQNHAVTGWGPGAAPSGDTNPHTTCFLASPPPLASQKKMLPQIQFESFSHEVVKFSESTFVSVSHYPMPLNSESLNEGHCPEWETTQQKQMDP